MRAILLMLLSSILAGLLIPISAFVLGVLGWVEPFQVSGWGHVIEVSKWRVAHHKEI